MHLKAVVDALEPQRLGLYWPIRGEFNAARAFTVDLPREGLPLALPFAQRSPRQLYYRAWDGAAPVIDDECGIPTALGDPVLPDVVLVPCLGYTANGYRLGYGAGYFDRWMAAHPQVTAIGVAWAVSEIVDPSDFAPQPHDQPLALVVTEEGVVA
jgi:5,10-methenyltetrahydrofolate synthetase